MNPNSPRPSEAPLDEAPLESWKEIAAHLKRDVRTVRRWEKFEELPVHRHMHLSRASVYAFPSELDAWVASRKPAAEPAPAPRWRTALALAATLALSVLTAGSSMLLAPSSAADGPAIVVKRLWSGEGTDAMGGPSPDGKLLTFVDWSTGDLAVRDLTTEENRRLTNKGTWSDSDEYAEFSVVSPDGNRVAYAWFNGKSHYELRTIGMDGKNIRVLYSNEEVQYVQPVGWTPDGRHIIAVLSLLDRTNRFVIVSVADGTTRVLKTFDWRYPLGRLSPDGRWLAYSFPPREEAPERDLYLLALDGSHEATLVEHPAHDFLLGWSPDGGQIVFASDRTGSNAAWTLSVAGGRAEGSPRIVRQDLGRISPMGTGRSGTLYYSTTPMRDVVSAEIDVPAGRFTSEPHNVADRFQGNNYAAVYSRDGKYLAYFSSRNSVPSGVGARSIVVQSTETGESRELRPLLSLPNHPVFSRPDWSDDGKFLYLIATDTKGRRGYFRVDGQTGQHEILIPFVPPVHVPRVDLVLDGNSALIKRQAPNELPALVLRNLATGAERVLHRAAHIHAWGVSPDRKFIAYTTVSPDDAKAMAPQVPNSNRLVVQSLESGEIRELHAVPRDREFASVAWTPDQRYLLYHIRPGEGELSENEPRGVWRIPVAGGKPELTPLQMGPRKLSSATFHPGGRRIAFTDFSADSVEIWVMENFLPAVRAGN
ncbi:MAG TPA: hypothetical protein VGA40_06010 [Candidatus Acidoferrales bacterium]